MTATTHARRNLADMTEKELVAIRMLINGLSKIEYWISQHAMKLRGEARDATVGVNECATDANIRVDVRCMLCEADPAFDPGSENIVATLDGRAVLRPDTLTCGNNGREPGDPTFRALSDMHVCGLFRDLYEHGVARDWDTLFRIGEISVEMSLDPASKARHVA